MKNLGWCIAILLAFSAGYFTSSYSSRKPLADEQAKDVEIEGVEAINNQPASFLNTTEQTSFNNASEHKYTEKTPTIKALTQQLKAITGEDPTSLTFSGLARLYDFIGSLSEGELRALVETLTSTNIKENTATLSLLFKRYSEINPAAALEYAKSGMEGSKLRNYFVRLSLSSLGKQNPLAAYNQFLNIAGTHQSNGGIRQQMLQGSLSDTFSALAKQDMALAIDKLSELNELGYKVEMSVWGLAQNLASKQDFVDLLTLTETIDNNAVAEGIINKWAQKNPEEAGAWLLESYTGDRADQLKDSFVRAWANHDKEKSGNWLVENTAPERINKTVVNHLRDWGWENPEAAMQWFAKQPSAVYNQNTFGEFINNIAYLNPKFAVKYMHYLDSEAQQQRLSSIIYGSLKDTNPQQAKAFLAQSPFKTEILEFEERMKEYLQN